MILCHDIKLAFIQAPQTGSTAVGKELVESYGGVNYGSKHGFVADLPATVLNSIDSWTVATSTRDPVEIAVSSYYKILSASQGRLPRANLSMTANRFAETMALRPVPLVEYLLTRYRAPWIDLRQSDRLRSNQVLRQAHLAADFEALITSTGTVPLRPLPERNKTPRTGPERVEMPTPEWIEYIFGPQRRAIEVCFVNSLDTTRRSVSCTDFHLSQRLISTADRAGLHPLSKRLAAALHLARAPFQPAHWVALRTLHRTRCRMLEPSR